MALRGTPARLAALLLVGSAAHAAPAPGTYAAQLCVQLADAAASCGPARAQWSGHRLQLRLDDIVYRLTLQARRERGRLGMQLMHGTMQIDGFSADYEWADDRLQFDDADKKTRYEVQFGERLRATR